ncbi:NAD(P)H-dependent oxidoreductase [Sphingobacterium sp. DR205]|uniref:NAD(P)H-dependent oxidoreductase n=1 Tax=Sphingobacterium sp. DR205 TaxID=2713573 RepID=UPI0013E4E859|nr:NAD(P)H-dependent oxidoreductase [Sphingobacterium sp. DR205]QIH35107.1 NAD(P)H-dependent oxidoreductase [Sphingobacterium sp. DR205]
MKTLVMIIHPNINESIVNKRWIEELKKYPENYEIHQLHEKYPDEIIDVKEEQQLIEKYDKIVFQFPFYWFNCPPFFKKWLDEVLTYGWAYGKSSGYKLAGKRIALALSVGVDEKEYSTTGKYKYNLDQLTSPFEITFNYIHANYRPLFAYYGIEQNVSEEWVERSVPLYLNFLEQL